MLVFVSIVQPFAFLGVCTCLSFLLEILLKVLYLYLLLQNLCVLGILSRSLFMGAQDLGSHQSPLWMGCSPGCQASCLSLALISLPGHFHCFSESQGLSFFSGLLLFCTIILQCSNVLIGICTAYIDQGEQRKEPYPFFLRLAN